MGSIRTIELFLVQVVFYFLAWQANDYLASLLSLIFGGVFLFLLLIALAAEFIEPSRVPRQYFFFMAASVGAPAVGAFLFLLSGGEVSWMGAG
jgi:hypothetical protein